MKGKSLNVIPNFLQMNVFLMDTFKDGENITRRKSTSVISKKQRRNFFFNKVFKYLSSISKQGNVQVLLKWILSFYFLS